MLSSAAAPLISAGAACTQSSMSQTTTTTATPVYVPPPPGTLSTTETKKSVNAYGDTYQSIKTAHGNENGVDNDSTTRTTVQPPAKTIITKKPLPR